MIPVFSSITDHNPEEGRVGDCHRACVASIMELPLESVPHFYKVSFEESSREANKKMQEWFNGKGLCFVQVPIYGSFDLEEALNWVATYSEESYYIFAGTSKKDNPHSVVGHKNKIAHDPTYGPDGHGIVCPILEKEHNEYFWWAGWIVLL